MTAKKLAGYTLNSALLIALLFFTLFPAENLSALSAEDKLAEHKYLGNEVIYQVVLDRFYDGNPDNNVFPYDPPGLYDPTRKDLPMSRWGGDITGLIEKLPYIADLGMTAIWISPVIENATELVPEEKGDLRGELNSNYHGYWGKDWYRVDRHLADNGEKGFDALERLVREAARFGIRIIVDTVINHSNNWDISKGALYKNGEFITDRYKDEKLPWDKRWYHYGGVLPLDIDVNAVGWTDFMKKYLEREIRLIKGSNEVYAGRLANLGDFFTEANDGFNPVMEYFIEAHLEMLRTGIAGFRVDTIPYVYLEVLRRFEGALRRNSPETILVGEWFAGGPTRAKSMNFYSSTGYTMFDFDLRWVFEKGFINDDNYGYRTFNWFLDSVSGAFQRMKAKGMDPNDMVNFVDNHDLPRLRDKGATRKGIEAAYAMLFALPGVPCIYYGAEQDLYDGTGRKGMADQPGGDPFNRSMMRFDKDSKLKEKFKELIEIRKNYDVFRYGRFANLDGQLRRHSDGKANAVSDKFGFISSCGRDRSYGLVREDGENLAFYFTNISDDFCHIEMDMNFNAVLVDSLSNDSFRNDVVKENELSIEMAPFDYLFLVFRKNNPAYMLAKE